MKKLLPLLLLNSFTLFAQAPDIEWENLYQWPLKDFCYGANPTPDGGYIMIGNTHSDEDGNPLGNGDMDIFIVKVDAQGDFEWTKRYGGSEFEIAQNAIQTPDGGYIVCGFTYSNDGDVTGAHDLADYWILKLNNLGELVWQTALGGTFDDNAYSILFTNDGGYIVAGNSSSTDGDVIGHHGNTNFPDAWIIKLTSEGSIQWQRSCGGTLVDNAASIQQTADGGFIFAGTTKSTNGDVSVNHGELDVWVVKLNTSGDLMWQKTLGGSGSEYASKIIELGDGSYMIAAQTTSTNGQVTLNHGAYDYWLVKIDGTGEIIWQKTYGGSADDICTNLSLIEGGGYIISGVSKSSNGDITQSFGGYDCWIVRVDETGNILWQKTLGTQYDDNVKNVYQSADGGFIAAGSKGIPFSDNDHDFYIFKLEPEMLSVTKPAYNKISVYPNPVSSFLNINAVDVHIVTVYDLQGRIIKKIGTAITGIDVSALEPNIYIVEIRTSSGIEKIKVVVE